MADLEGKTALVTGAAKGMGRAIALVLARHGADLAVTDVDHEAVLEVVKEISELGRVSVGYRHDVTSWESCHQVAADAVAQFGHVDILVNNAGVSRRVPFVELDEAEWDRVNDVCSKGVFMMSHAVAPHMLARRAGAIVHIASLVSKEGIPLFAHYSAAKASVIGLMHSMARELAAYDVRVNAVMPGVVRTPLWDANLLPAMVEEGCSTTEDAWAEVTAPIPLGRPQEPEDIGEAVAFLASDRARNITGVALNVTGGQLLG
jgi:NAD(P)-dependent dehydrogenase (short-subunit alcohol dehydrogenase family)